MRRYTRDESPGLRKDERGILAKRQARLHLLEERAASRAKALTLTPGRRWHRHVIAFVDPLRAEMSVALHLDGGPGWIDDVAADIEAFLFDTELTPEEVTSGGPFSKDVGQRSVELMHSLHRIRGIPIIILSRVFNRDKNKISEQIRRIDATMSMTENERGETR